VPKDLTRISAALAGQAADKQRAILKIVEDSLRLAAL
jgi:hypothetical protein